MGWNSWCLLPDQRSLVAIGTINVSLAIESPLGTTELTALGVQSEAIINRRKIGGSGLFSTDMAGSAQRLSLPNVCCV